MRKSLIVSLLAVGALPAFIAVGCADSFEDCSNTRSCPVEGDGDGSGGSGDGDGETGGSSVGGEGGETTVDPCDACSGETPACNDSDECVECTGDEHCSEGVCDVANEVCVGCVDAADCGPELPVCEANACVGCTLDADCGGHSDTPVCDAEPGICVGCLDRDDCGGDVCERATNTCLDRTAGAVSVCEECEFDDDCAVGQLCVEQVFDMQTIGSFCTWRRDGRPSTQAGSCLDDGEPFAGFVSGATSVEGETADLCALRSTSCPSFLQHSSVIAGCNVEITDDDACGVTGVDDGLCREPMGGGAARCTYHCGGDEDCSGAFTCVGAPDGYCSL